MHRYQVLGLMSGSSLDGVDLAFCHFDWEQGLVDWKIIQAETLPFNEQWQARLQHLPQASALDFAKTNTYFGHYLAQLVMTFLEKHNLEPDFIASHGHTIFHDPEKRYTIQIGDGGAMAALTGYPVINQFRTQDIAIDGEGAPLAPIADRYLLPGYDFYLNLGGIANISAAVGDRYLAFDLSGANQILNALAQLADQPFDQGGQLAAQGQLLQPLFDQLNQHPFFEQPYPKSLDNQWTVQHFVQPFLAYEGTVVDRLCTAVHHIAYQVSQAIQQLVETEQFQQPSYRMIVTGGGAYNHFLLDQIQKYCPEIEIVVPESMIIDFKEAALMSLMGVLRLEQHPNTISSVTGARQDTVSGAIYQGWRKQIAARPVTKVDHTSA